MTSLTHLTLDLPSHRRFEVIPLSEQVTRHGGDILQRHQRWLYCSLHTTAGYLSQRLCAQLCYQQENIQRFIAVFQQLFPAGREYYHDRLELRSELSEQQRQCEPKNGDSHLIFMSAGLSNCVTYTHRPDSAVFLVELDGVNGSICRTRRTMVVGFNTEVVLRQTRVAVPISQPSIGAVHLSHPHHGLLHHVDILLKHCDLDVGKVEIALAPQEQNAGLTVNEYESLLMQHDMTAVLRNPFLFLARPKRESSDDLGTVPHPTTHHAKQGLMRTLRALAHALCLNYGCTEHMISSFLQWPKSRFFHMQRRISWLVSQGHILQGTYQSPILVQWNAARHQTRSLDIVITKFA